MQLKRTNMLFKTSSFKSHSSMCKLFFESAATAINYDSLSLWIISKDFFTNHYDILSLQKLNNKLNEEFQLLL